MYEKHGEARAFLKQKHKSEILEPRAVTAKQQQKVENKLGQLEKEAQGENVITEVRIKLEAAQQKIRTVRNQSTVIQKLRKIERAKIFKHQKGNGGLGRQVKEIQRLHIQCYQRRKSKDQKREKKKT